MSKIQEWGRNKVSYIFIFVVVIELSVQASISSNRKVMKYHVFISVVVIELSVRCLKYRARRHANSLLRSEFLQLLSSLFLLSVFLIMFSLKLCFQLITFSAFTL